MSKRPQIKQTDVASLAFETNGRGYLGFIVELPGAFVRGRTEEEAVAKVHREADLYLKWLGVEQKHDYKVQVIQRHRSTLTVEDADSEILLQADQERLSDREFQNLLDLVRFSGETFSQLYANTRFKDRIDESRIRKTFYGDNPATLQAIFEHVKRCQYYYLSRMKIAEQTEDDFMTIRDFCLAKLESIYRENNNAPEHEIDNERWTLKKVLRRYVWHDRIHGKAMTRILDKQRQLGLIGEYEDPFHFRETFSRDS